MPKPLAWFFTLFKGLIDESRIHFIHLYARSCIVRNIKLKGKRTQLFKLKLIYQHIFIIGKANFESFGLTTLEISNCPNYFPLFHIYICYTIFTLRSTLACSGCTYPLLSYFIKWFYVVDILQTKGTLAIILVGKVNLSNAWGKLKSDFHEFCPQVRW